MKKTVIIRSIKLLALILPIILFVLFAQTYLFRFTDHSTERIRRFYQEEENSLDVVILGASEVFSGFSPALAYEQCGFTSYMYAIDGNPGALYKYQLKEVLTKQQPQLILVEVNGFLYKDSQHEIEEARLRTFAENIPMSLNRLEVIYRFKEEDKLSCLIPFIKYHGDWIKGKHLLDYYPWRVATSDEPSLLKGITTGTVIDPELPKNSITPSANGENLISDDVLTDFIVFCRENNLNVIFTRFPHKESAAQAVWIDQIQEIVLKHGYSFLNLEEYKDDMGIDVQNDYYNSEHLNVYGQKKLTTFLGNCLINDYALNPMTQTTENRLHWEECTDYYHAFYNYAHEMTVNGIEKWPSESADMLDLLSKQLQESKS